MHVGVHYNEFSQGDDDDTMKRYTKVPVSGSDEISIKVKLTQRKIKITGSIAVRILISRRVALKQACVNFLDSR